MKHDSAGSLSGEVCRLNSWLLVNIDFLIESIALVFDICICKTVKSMQPSANISRVSTRYFAVFRATLQSVCQIFRGPYKINLPMYTIRYDSINNKKRTDELLPFFQLFELGCFNYLLFVAS